MCTMYRLVLRPLITFKYSPTALSVDSMTIMTSELQVARRAIVMPNASAIRGRGAAVTRYCTLQTALYKEKLCDLNIKLLII